MQMHHLPHGHGRLSTGWCRWPTRWPASMPLWTTARGRRRERFAISCWVCVSPFPLWRYGRRMEDLSAVTAFAGLAGALVGALVAGAFQLIAVKMNSHTVRAKDRHERASRYVAEFWAACDVYWKASISLADVVDEITHDREGRTPERTAALERKRQESFSGMRSAKLESSKLHAQLRIEFPAMADTAAELDAASYGAGPLERLREKEAKYQGAQFQYEAQARKVLASIDKMQWWRRRGNTQC